MFLKNQSILKQAEASDQGAFYQAKSIKEHLADAVASLSDSSEFKSRFLAHKSKLDKEKAEVQTEARKLQAESRKLGDDSEAKLHPYERLALALTFIQIAITLAAITVFTKRRWSLWGLVTSAAVGIVMATAASF